MAPSGRRTLDQENRLEPLPQACLFIWTASKPCPPSQFNAFNAFKQRQTEVNGMLLCRPICPLTLSIGNEDDHHWHLKQADIAL